MSARRAFAALLLAGMSCCCAAANAPAQQGSGPEPKLASAKDPASSVPAVRPAAGASANSAAAPTLPAAAKQEDADALRIEGEKRFRANCGRCHQAPHKLSPRMMATAIRHMRVRATITDEDMRVILNYMTQ